MPGQVRLGLLIGAAIVIVDWIAGSIVRDLPSGDPLQEVLTVVDLFANIVLFGSGGYLGFRATGVARGGAEVGVIAGVLAGGVAGLRLLLAPLPAEPAPGTADLIGLLAINVALGGLVGLAGAWLARVRPS
ncbi:MAG: hypothetical protein HY690_07460 [Chloroflexi bacterium]|nr:hypothetical protein [Chloroflexota bacterium]